jgi:ankyrin repeat protein
LANRDSEGLRRLLDRGSSPNVSSGGMTPLRYAVLIGDGRAVRMLLEKGANPNPTDPAEDAPLLLALQRGHREVVANLLDFGANPNVRDRSGRTPLQLAAGDPYFIRKLTEKGAH